MQSRLNTTGLHALRLVMIAALIALCIVYPFFPGGYDSLALPLSTLTQVFGVLGSVLLVPVGVTWLGYSAWRRSQRKRGLQQRPLGHHFVRASLIVVSLLALLLILLAAIALSSRPIGVALGLYVILSLWPRLKQLRRDERDNFKPAPLYLVSLPIAALLTQLIAAGYATDQSRLRGIANAAELIEDIEAYHTRHGRYPTSLAAVWKDYDPSVVGIERYHYSANGAGYDLYFEQPRFLLDNIGTREFVVYNARDEHLIVSHTAWILELDVGTLRANQGWYDVKDTPVRHWRSFLFD